MKAYLKLDYSYFEQRSKLNPETGCIEWALHINMGGYGTLKHNRKQQMAHRASWERLNGPIPNGKIVCHKCDNRKCINPDHLFLGTTQDNVNDKMQKGRFVKVFGTDSPASKLTNEQVASIRADCRSQALIAADYGISQSNVSFIKTGKGWTHLPVVKEKSMNIRELSAMFGLPYESLKDRIFGGYMTTRDAVNRTAAQFGVNLHIDMELVTP